MNRAEIQNLVDQHTLMVWDILCELRPDLVRFDPPKIVLNGRLWRMAGYCCQNTRCVNLGLKFFLFSEKYAKNMTNVILPHEIIHQADFDLYGESELKCGHGENWRNLMLEYGLPANKYHSMEIPRK
jgi:predicted SprT family Zn-dependent metalloprotease